jgi:hypothetical protein
MSSSDSGSSRLLIAELDSLNRMRLPTSLVRGHLRTNCRTEDWAPTAAEKGLPVDVQADGHTAEVETGEDSGHAPTRALEAGGSTVLPAAPHFRPPH